MALNLSVIENSVKKNNKCLEISLDENEKFVQKVVTNIEKIIETKKINNETKPISIDICENIDTKQKYYFSYKHDDVSDLPQFFNDLLQSNDYYVLGLKKENQFINALLCITDPDFKLLSDSNKNLKIDSLFENLFNNLESYYKNFNYKQKKIPKKELNDDVISRNLESVHFQRLISDFLEINCVELNFNTMSYKYLNDNKMDEDLIILVKQNKTYLPILNSYNKQLGLDIMKKINTQFTNKTEIQLSNSLQHIRNYKLKDLQNLAEKNNITLSFDLNGKKKTKQQLYDELELIQN